ncbi:MAG: imidazole glycerol phosphate synthase subunit HisH [Sulfurospirillum sp.]|nr:imidazole glycerol phosphate synthase subunit HisH [Sulfurospirillum sp.]
MITLIDYNMGNLRSVQNAFTKLGVSIEVTQDPQKLAKADKVILPGVGAFGDAMLSLRSNGMGEAITEFARSGKPLLGICLGMQLLLESGEEFGSHKGLGLIPGKVVAFDTALFAQKLKVPHMGWNELFVQKSSPLFAGLPKDFYLYFVHSFHATCKEEYVIGKSFYGYEFVSAIAKDNIYGLQPHPEKSHENGLAILKNFIRM